ncbi:hypothetical protein [uncultured Thiothrix sp.]|uniref:hypothetical protein n=1 Tax=uncultured Thiothrix sp. TaxID=223185 RepID=UPI0026394E6D|nr:hypothetical protein [uncultured Thiothrix sp.]
MKINYKFLGLICISWLVSFSAYAETARLDDSASARSIVEARSVTNETGMSLADSHSPQFMFLKFGLVQYRLATAAYKGKKAKIYYVIPMGIEGLQNPKALTVTWKGNSLFTDGEGHAGERKLVWSGTVTEDWMQDELDLEMQVELAQLRLREGQGFGFESYFEIETNE